MPIWQKECPLILILDELGKNLEQVAVGENDVYLLQLLAELPQQKFPVFFFGLLHSAFSDYGDRQALTLDAVAQRLRAALANAREPDVLIFKDIPSAFGVDLSATSNDKQVVRSLTKALTQALHELQNAYGRLLESCRAALAESVRAPKNTDLRQYLATIAGLLAGQVLDPVFRRFMNAAQERDKNDQQWLEGVVMVIADKPAEAWRDDDRNTFEANLATLAQKFLNLHPQSTHAFSITTASC